jgi:ankyrin repeat protein
MSRVPFRSPHAGPATRTPDPNRNQGRRIRELQSELMRISSATVPAILSTLTVGALRRCGSSPPAFDEFFHVLLLTAEYRPNQLQDLVDLTAMLYSAAADGSLWGNLKAKTLDRLRQVTTHPYDHSSSCFGWFRYVYFCLTQIYCTHEEIVSEIEAFVDVFPGCKHQISFLAAWFLPEIKRINPQLFDKVCSIISETSFLTSHIPVAEDFSDVDGLPDLIYCVFPPNSVGDAVRSDDVDMLTTLANETDFSVTASMPPAFFGCYEAWRSRMPTLLEASAYFGSVNVFKYLVLNGALPPDDRGQPNSVVEWAYAGGNLEIIRFCVQRDYDLVANWAVAVRTHQYEVVDWLQHTQLAPDDPSSMLNAAAASENMRYLLVAEPREAATIQELLQIAGGENRCWAFQYLYGLCENPTQIRSFPIVECLVSSASLECLQFALLKFGVVKPGSSDLTPLHVACHFCLLDIANLVLSQSSDWINMKRNGMTPLMLACRAGHVSVVRYLMKRVPSLDVNLESDERLDAFEYAIQSGHSAIVREFLAFPKFAAAGRRLMNPIELAIQNKHLDVVLLLLADARFRATEAALRLAAQIGFAAGVEALLEIGKVDVNSRSVDMMSAMHWAVKSRSVECVNALLKSEGLDINAQDEKWRLPTHYAALVGSAEILELFLRNALIAINE